MKIVAEIIRHKNSKTTWKTQRELRRKESTTILHKSKTAWADSDGAWTSSPEK